MSTVTFTPPFDRAADAADLLRARAYVVLDADGTAALTGVDAAALARFAATWDDLPPDPYLKDGGRYRRRRHSCFVVEDGRTSLAPHRAHWQPVEYNALHGGMQRWFEPMDGSVVAAPAWSALIAGLGALCDRVAPAPRWHVEAHQFRIDTEGGIGRPTPEGAHRDGVDFVAVLLVGRSGVKGGETRVFDAAGPDGRRFTMLEPGTLLLLDDARMIHETTPIQPLADVDGQRGHRDTLVLTYRAAGFQGDEAAGGAAYGRPATP